MFKIDEVLSRIQKEMYFQLDKPFSPCESWFDGQYLNLLLVDAKSYR